MATSEKLGMGMKTDLCYGGRKDDVRSAGVHVEVHARVEKRRRLPVDEQLRTFDKPA